MHSRILRAWPSRAALPLGALLAALSCAAGLRGKEKAGLAPPPVSPFAPNVQAPPHEDARPGTVTLSNGQTVRGLVLFTRSRKLELFEDAQRKWHAFDVPQLARIEVRIEEEKEEREWRWKEGGSDEKVYTGRTYVDRKYLTTITLADGRTQLTGHVRGTVFYVQPSGGEARRFFLRHDQRGEFNQKPADLLYVRSVVLEPGGQVQDAPASPKTGKDG